MSSTTALALVILLTAMAVIIAVFICTTYPPFDLIAPPDDGIRFEHKRIWECKRCGMVLPEFYEKEMLKCPRVGSLPAGTACPLELLDIVIQAVV